MLAVVPGTATTAAFAVQCRLALRQSRPRKRLSSIPTKQGHHVRHFHARQLLRHWYQPPRSHCHSAMTAARAVAAADAAAAPAAICAHCQRHSSPQAPRQLRVGSGLSPCGNSTRRAEDSSGWPSQKVRSEVRPQRMDRRRQPSALPPPSVPPPHPPPFVSAQSRCSPLPSRGLPVSPAGTTTSRAEPLTGYGAPVQ